MAFTIVQTQELKHKSLYVVTFTSNDSATITVPDRSISGITFQSNGNDGGGTLTLFVSNDGINFEPAGFNSVIDSRNMVLVTSITTDGAWTIPAEILSFRYFQFDLAGSTTPALVLHVAIEYQAGS